MWYRIEITAEQAADLVHDELREVIDVSIRAIRMSDSVALYARRSSPSYPLSYFLHLPKEVPLRIDHWCNAKGLSCAPCDAPDKATVALLTGSTAALTDLRMIRVF